MEIIWSKPYTNFWTTRYYFALFFISEHFSKSISASQAQLKNEVLFGLLDLLLLHRLDGAFGHRIRRRLQGFRRPRVLQGALWRRILRLLGRQTQWRQSSGEISPFQF